jgi:mersacidin/lichenicidin family type 2 lantibiotic
MKAFDIIRAWKDVSYRNSLSAEERAALPANPAGSIELDDGELNAVIGGLDEPGISVSAACQSKKPYNCSGDGVDETS